jgi:hypothetical protein
MRIGHLHHAPKQIGQPPRFHFLRGPSRNFSGGKGYGTASLPLEDDNYCCWCNSNWQGARHKGKKIKIKFCVVSSLTKGTLQNICGVSIIRSYVQCCILAINLVLIHTEAGHWNVGCSGLSMMHQWARCSFNLMRNRENLSYCMSCFQSAYARGIWPRTHGFSCWMRKYVHPEDRVPSSRH